MQFVFVKFAVQSTFRYAKLFSHGGTTTLMLDEGRRNDAAFRISKVQVNC